MRKLIALVVLALLGFYVAWPAWSGYRIAKAVTDQDQDLLASKVDFPGVRTSLRPIVAAEVTGRVERAKREAGPLGGLIAGQVKDDIIARIVDSALNSVVTPENVIRIARQGGNIREAFERIVIEQIGRPPSVPGNSGGDQGVRLPGGIQLPPGLPGIGNLPGRRPGPAPDEPAPRVEPAKNTGAEKKQFGLGNIKKFSINGPLSFTIGVARDPAASEPDLTANMAFTGGDWKVVSVVPRL